mgnify:CR=1 FL=1
MEEKLKLINQKRQQLISQIGKERLSETLAVLDELLTTQKLLPSELVSVTEYLRILKLLPE